MTLNKKDILLKLRKSNIKHVCFVSMLLSKNITLHNITFLFKMSFQSIVQENVKCAMQIAKYIPSFFSLLYQNSCITLTF